MRSSLLIQDNKTNILIDTGTDFRLQAIGANLTHLDAIFFTHAHADHLHGLDDTRSLSYDGPIPVYASSQTADEIQKRFEYIFTESQVGGGKPRIEIKMLTTDSVSIGDVTLAPIPILHGALPILGFRIASAAYLVDCSFIPIESYGLLEGVEILFIGALRYRSHPTHFSIEQAVEAVGKIGARKAWFTHICHDIDHGTLAKKLPDHILPAYDGLVVDLPN